MPRKRATNAPNRATNALPKRRKAAADSLHTIAQLGTESACVKDASRKEALAAQEHYYRQEGMYYTTPPRRRRLQLSVLVLFAFTHTTPTPTQHVLIFRGGP